ncbi:unnamed protein product [Dimorphilus gyrociliatus]|uniref:Uncharacterized protein n=1 Tax=Dimorphilus gyrociliatus TaxID=2664684 RepID=A0A7I8VEG6_9ANNE|nr:unnamed protein product [Dimorphilus gyrociliatus]
MGEVVHPSDKRLNDEIEFSEDDFSLFINKIQGKIEKIDEEKRIALHKLNTEITSLMISIHDRQEDIRTEIELFYSEKKDNLKNIVSYIERLYENRKKIPDKILKSDFSKMIENVKYYADNLMRKKGVFQKSDSLNGLEIGNLKIPNFENPIKEEFIEFHDKIDKVISNENGFYVLRNSCEIVELQRNQVIYSVDGKIDSITMTNDNRISYIQLLKSSATVSIITKPFYSSEYYTIQKQSNERFTEQFAVLKDFILLYQNSTIVKRHKKTTETVSLSSRIMKFEHNIVMENVLYNISDNLLVFADLEKNEWKDIIIQELDEGGNKSVLRKIIDYITTKGFLVVCANENIILICPQSLLAMTIKMERVFPQERLLNYRIDNEQIIFCLSCLEDESRLIFKYFPINLNYNFV